MTDRYGARGGYGIVPPLGDPPTVVPGGLGAGITSFVLSALVGIVYVLTGTALGGEVPREQWPLYDFLYSEAAFLFIGVIGFTALILAFSCLGASRGRRLGLGLSTVLLALTVHPGAMLLIAAVNGAFT